MIHTSVIIPSLHSPWIDQVIEALHAQEYDLAGTEVLIVGQDRQKLIKPDRLIRFLQTETPVPPAIARNRGIQAARGTLLCFLDADCIPARDWLQKLTQPYLDPNIHVIGGVIQFPHDLWTLSDTIAHFSNVIDGATVKQQSQLPTLNFSARRTVFEQVGLFDEEFKRPSGEDTELTKRMIKHGYQLWLAPDARIYHLPKRKGLLDIAQRAYYHGQAAATPSFRHQLLEESRLFAWPLLLTTAIPRAILVTLRIFWNSPHLHQYWYTAPIVMLLKLIWAISVAMAIRRAEKQNH